MSKQTKARVHLTAAPCRGGFPDIPAGQSALQVLSAGDLPDVKGSFPPNSAGDPLPELFSFDRCVLGALCQQSVGPGSPCISKQVSWRGPVRCA